MKIAYPLTVDDNMAFVRHQYDTMPAIRRSRRRSLIVASLMYPFFGALAYVERSFVVLGVGFAIATAYVLFVGYYHRRGYIKRVEKWLHAKREGHQDEHVELTLEGDDLLVKTDASDVTAPMERFSRLERTENYTFLYINEQKAIIIPKDSLTEGDYSAFVSQLRKQYDESHSVE